VGDKYHSVRQAITAIFESNHRCYGYRRLQASLARQRVPISVKVVQRLMKQESLVVAKPKRRRYASYLGEISPAPENLINRDFQAAAPNKNGSRTSQSSRSLRAVTFGNVLHRRDVRSIGSPSVGSASGRFPPSGGEKMILSRTVFKLAAAGLVAAGALTVAATANADTSWSVGINVPGIVVSEPVPVYTYPAPTYYQAPRPAYSVPPPVYYDPAARWEERRAERWEERRAERREWRRRQWEREQYHRYYENRD
jgi:hypothetical protein